MSSELERLRAIAKSHAKHAQRRHLPRMVACRHALNSADVRNYSITSNVRIEAKGRIGEPTRR